MGDGMGREKKYIVLKMRIIELICNDLVIYRDVRLIRLTLLEACWFDSAGGPGGRRLGASASGCYDVDVGCCKRCFDGHRKQRETMRSSNKNLSWTNRELQHHHDLCIIRRTLCFWAHACRGPWLHDQPEIS